MDFAEMMDLADHGPDTFIGTGPEYPWGGLFGGQIVAQALRAAARTVDADFAVHSLHAYFIRRGDHAAPIRFEVDRVRDGRSFATRSVLARQTGGAILSMSSSFQRRTPTGHHQTVGLPTVADPASIAESSWTPMMRRRLLGGEVGASGGWLQVPQGDPADPVLAACALAFASDDLATDAVQSLHQASLPPGSARWNAVSLDHALWFQAPVPGDGWQLHTFRADGLLGLRGLSLGRIFSADGTHLATVAQEVLLRDPV